MTSLIFSADLTINPFGVTLNENIDSLDDFIGLIQGHDDIKTDKIINAEGRLHCFLIVVVDGEVAANDDLEQSLAAPREIMVFNAIAGG